MNLFRDIFSVLTAQWQTILGMVLMVFVSMMLVWSMLKLFFRDRLDSGDYLSLAAAGWILPLSLASVLWLGWGTIQRSAASAFVLLVLVVIAAVVLFVQTRKDFLPGSRSIVLSLSLLFLLFIFLRLAFLFDVTIPLYFDSAHHYLTAKNLIHAITSAEQTSFQWTTTSYYHMGFHLLTAWTASVLRTDLVNTILVLGQVIVAAISLPLFAIIKHATRSTSAGLFAVLLAAFGWHMPAYAVNWGKYPALMSLPLITFVLSLAYLSLRYKDIFSQKKYLALNAVLVFGVFVATLAHSRSLIIFGIIALAWISVTGWETLSTRWRVISFLVVLASTVWMTFYIETKDIFGLLFDRYWDRGFLVTGSVLFLAVFAQWRYPRLAFASVLVILMVLGSLLIPVRIPGYGALSLLDRPFVEMFLYLPLTILAATGLAGLEQSLLPLLARWQGSRLGAIPYMSGLVIVLLIVNTILNYNFYQAGCCSIVGNDDRVALDWIDKNLPPDARILISSTELRVLPTDAPQGAAGGDAGAWITPLTDRITLPLPYQSDFTQQATFDTICQWGAQYLYVGEAGAIFNNDLITLFPDRYRILLSLPTTKVYQIVGCP